MIIDSHCHLESENPIETMLRTMDACGVDKAVLFAATCENLPSIPKGLLWLTRTLLQTPFSKIAISVYEDAVNSIPGKVKVNGKHYDIYKYPDNQPVTEVIKKNRTGLSDLCFSILNQYSISPAIARPYKI